LRLKLTPGGCIPERQTIAHIASARKRDLPIVKGSGRLALVGGGLSAADHIETLRQWDGEVWAINGAATWCIANGINAALVTVHPTITEIAPSIRRVVLGSECAPGLFDACSDRDLRILPDVEINGEMQRGGTTATSVALALPYMGFADVTFFGLEGSYGERSHNYDVYQDPNELWVVVKACDGEYRTKLEFLHQSQLLAELVHKYPQFEERSGGLLRALVKDHEHDEIDMSPILLEEIERASHGIAA
jgi:hypothetical protein